MISPGTAALAISIAKGLIKLGGRVDRLLAEKEAVTGNLILPMPAVTGGLDVIQKSDRLREFLASSPDAGGEDRSEIEGVLRDQDALTSSSSAAAKRRIANLIVDLFARHLPEQAFEYAIRPDGDYIKALQAAFPSLNLDDTETRLAAFYVRAGNLDGNINYAGKLGLLVVDVIAEFGAENASLFIRDAGTQSLVSSVLKRFSEPELETYNRWSPLLRHAISATLNGALDARESFQGDNKWVGALLDAMDEARKDPAGGDDYLLGLLQGKGYRLLLSKGLSEASERLSGEDAKEFQNIAADVLKAAAPLVNANTRGFAGFFQNHWGDLLGAGLKSLEKHGPALLADQPELLRETLIAVLKRLAATNGRELFTNDTLFNIVDAAIGAIAARPELAANGIDEAWLKKLIESVTKTVGNLTIQKVFSREGLETIVKDAAETFAAHPELIVERPDLLQSVVSDILKKITGVDRLSAKTLANAAVGGALRAVADNPGFLDTKYSSVVAGFAGKLSDLVAANSLSTLQARDILQVGMAAMLENPLLFNEQGDKITKAILGAIVDASANPDLGLLVKATLLRVAKEVFHAFATSGKSLAGMTTAPNLQAKLFETIQAALFRAEPEIGKEITVADLPGIVGSFVRSLLRGELATVDPNDERFERLFAQILLNFKTIQVS